MKLAAICCTYKRPQCLEHAIESFLRQDYPADLRELLILDDAGQYTTQKHDGWTLVSIPVRFMTLGEKRNATVALASNVDAYCVWDDDDIYLPWHMSAAAAALRDADYTLPSKVWTDRPPRLAVHNNTGTHHGSWAFRRGAFVESRGYPSIDVGEDCALLNRFREMKLRRGDPILFDRRPSYIYRWCTVHTQHLSAAHSMLYGARASVPFGQVEKINPNWAKDWVQLCTDAMAH